MQVVFCFFQFFTSTGSLISDYLTPEIVATLLTAGAVDLTLSAELTLLCQDALRQTSKSEIIYGLFSEKYLKRVFRKSTIY